MVGVAKDAVGANCSRGRCSVVGGVIGVAEGSTLYVDMCWEWEAA